MINHKHDYGRKEKEIRSDEKSGNLTRCDSLFKKITIFFNDRLAKLKFLSRTPLRNVAFFKLLFSIFLSIDEIDFIPRPTEKNRLHLFCYF